MMLPSSIVQSIAGTDQAERLVAKDVRRRERSGEKPKLVDEVELTEVETPEAIEPVRKLQGNTNEETALERRRQRPTAGVTPKEPALDIEG